MPKPLITELPPAGRQAAHLPEPGDAAAVAELIPAAQCRTTPPELPALDEATLRAHFVDAAGLADAAACALAERAAALPGLLHVHPRQAPATLQGLLEVLYEAARALAAMTGLDRFTLQPPTKHAAEHAALLIARANFARTEPQRREVLAPRGSSALATAAGIGLLARPVERLPDGDIDLDSLLSCAGEATLAVVASWLTPDGAFDRSLAAAAEVAHTHGALACVDATGLAALVGRTRLREAGADIAWLSLRELCPTATGAALGVRAALTEFLPGPLVGRARSGYELDDELPRSIGRLALAPANALDALGVFVQVRLLGEAGLRARGEWLVLEANRLALADGSEYPARPGRRLLLPPGSLQPAVIQT